MKEELGFGDDKVESKKNWRNLDVCVLIGFHIVKWS
jgi:hypothetical protein